MATEQLTEEQLRSSIINGTYEYGSALVEPSEVDPYPFISISEIVQAGKQYGEKALEKVKEITSYPFENLKQVFAEEKPTGIIKKEFDLQAYISNIFKPPWIFIILGIFGLWVFGVFKRK